ncbi:MAG: alcohol dehydrogenase catalytic domain-containing protein [Gemmataceae bacterium]
MKAIVFHGLGDIRLDEDLAPRIRQDTDAIVRLTASAIYGTDLYMVHGTTPGMKPGTILGHDGVGVIEEVGKAVTGFRRVDRVVVPSTICCGSCSYCKAGYQSQCDNANPNGPQAGTLAIIGVNPETMTRFPIGMAMMKNLTIQMGNCPHRKNLPQLIKVVQGGKVDLTRVLTNGEPLTDAISAYKAFDQRRPGWVKLQLKLAARARATGHLVQVVGQKKSTSARVSARSPCRVWRREGARGSHLRARMFTCSGTRHPTVPILLRWCARRREATRSVSRVNIGHCVIVWLTQVPTRQLSASHER